MLETARLADRLGYDLLGVQDHPYQRAHLDSLALLGAAPLMNYQPPAQAVEAQALIDRAAREAGRDPSDIRRIYNIPGALAAAPPSPARDTDESIVGPPDHWAEVLTHLALDVGFDTFIIATPPDPDMLRTFISEVAPRVRERVETARAETSADRR